MARGDERAADPLRRIQAELDGVKLEEDNTVSQAEDEKTRAKNLQVELTKEKEARGKAEQEIGSLKGQLELEKTKREKAEVSVTEKADLLQTASRNWKLPRRSFRTKKRLIAKKLKPSRKRWRKSSKNLMKASWMPRKMQWRSLCSPKSIWTC